MCPNGQSDTLNETGFQPVCLPHANAIVTHRDIDMRSFWNVSWYRRHFSPPVEYRGRRFFLEFQGATQVTEVFVNGTPAGMHQGAYTPFSFDITDQVRFGADNVIAVRVDSRKHKEIPPEGIVIDYMLFGGITRDVSMVITGPLHMEWVFASRDSIDPARVNVRVPHQKQRPCRQALFGRIADHRFRRDRCRGRHGHGDGGAGFVAGIGLCNRTDQRAPPVGHGASVPLHRSHAGAAGFNRC